MEEFLVFFHGILRKVLFLHKLLYPHVLDVEWPESPIDIECRKAWSIDHWSILINTDTLRVISMTRMADMTKYKYLVLDRLEKNLAMIPSFIKISCLISIYWEMGRNLENSRFFSYLWIAR